jgi:branched-chain amino acid transport system ATP-binding protein
MNRNKEQQDGKSGFTSYGLGPVDTVLSVDEVERQAAKLAAEGPSREQLSELVDKEPLLTIEGLRAGYGKMVVLHQFDLLVGAGQSLCLIGPNGAGKSTILHSIYGFTTITGGTIKVRGNDVTRLSPNEKLKKAGIAYILQDASIFPDMTVEENMLMGGFLMDKPSQAREAAEKVLDKYPQLAERRNQQAGVLSGGERRLLEISRALIMEPEVLLVDEPSIGLEPRFIGMVFEILDDLQHKEGKTIIMVEQNAKKGLEFADIGYVLVSGQLAMADSGDELLQNPEVGRLFLGDQAAHDQQE